MDWKLFFSTFVIIFVAELGDKTQLAVMAASAGSRTSITVFLGAASALVMSTLIAVVVGAILPKFLPEKFLKIAAGIAFLVFGILYLKDAFFPRESPKEPVAISQTQPGIIKEHVLKSALYFEEQEINDFVRMIACIENDSLKGMLDTLIEEEKEHIIKIKSILSHKESSPTEIMLEERSFSCPSKYTLTKQDTRSKEILGKLIKREEMMAKFYNELATKSLIKDVRSIFAFLANEEEHHKDTLQDIYNTLA